MPVGVQCPISSSLGEFPAIGIGSGVLGFRPYWCPSPFHSLSILLLSVASTPHCHSFAYSICNFHPCASLRCKQAGLLLLALRWPPCLSTWVLGSGIAFCCPPNWWHT